jgi:AcrR family transcriptional regulator
MITKTTAVAPTHKPRWHRRKEARPGEIEAAALDLFVERGYAATKLEDVARRAGVTKGTMYLYFDSKEALFKAVIRGAMLPLFERGEQLIDAHRGTARELLADFIRGWWQSIGESRVSGLPKLIMAEASNFPELARFYHEEVVSRGRRLFARVIERGVASGEFRTVDTPYALRVLGFSVIFAAIWKHSMGACEPEPFDFERYLDAHIDLALNGLLIKAGEEPARG